VNGRYRLQRRLGSGADAQVFAVDDLRIGHLVALKVLTVAKDRAAQERLRTEFATLSALRHDSLLPVYELDTLRTLEHGESLLQPGLLFQTSLLCTADAGSLSSLSPQKRVARLVDLIGAAAAALDVIHAAGLVHHDVKPANILLVDKREGGQAVYLADLGLAAARERAGLRGTLAYLAPDALQGGAGPELDIYALGATALAAWTGRPARAGTSADILRSLTSGADPTELAIFRKQAPPSLVALVSQLLAPPDQRPSAFAIVEETTRQGARLHGALTEAPARRTLRPPRWVGAGESVETLLRRLPEGGLVVVRGPSGSGRSRLVAEARRRAQLLEPQAWLGPRLADVAAECGLAVDSRGFVGRLLAQLEKSPTVVCLDLADQPPRGAVGELVALAARGALERSTLIVEAPSTWTPPDGEVTVVDLQPLTEVEVAALCHSMLGSHGPELAPSLVAASGGLPARLVQMIRVLADQRDPTPADVATLHSTDLVALLAMAARTLAPEAWVVAEAAAVLGRAATAGELSALVMAGQAAFSVERFAAGLAAARLAGFVADDGSRYRLPSEAHGKALLELAPTRQAGHQIALALVGHGLDPDGELHDRARHLLHGIGRSDDTHRAVVRLVADRLGKGDLRSAELALHDLRALGPLEADAQLLDAELALAAGDYDAAIARASIVGNGQLLVAKAHQRAGRRSEAMQALEALVASDDPAARGLFGRLLFDEGRYDEAAAVCAQGTRSATVDEVLGLAELYRGHLDEAERAFASLGASDDQLLVARAHSLVGMVAQARDDLPAATVAFQSALDLARAGGDLHGAAVYAANLGAVLREQGEWGRALEPSAAAARDLGRLGKAAEAAHALVNHGNLLFSLGDLDGAAAVADRAEELANGPRERAFTRMLRADVARRRGQLDDALAGNQAALAELSGPRDRLIALRALAELEAELRHPHAAATLAEAKRTASEAGATDWVLVSEARIALSRPSSPSDGALVNQLAALAERAGRSLRLETAFRASLLEARLRIRAADQRATDALSTAHVHWEKIRMRSPELRRPAVDEDPDATKLRALLGVARAPVAAVGSSRWRRLSAINKRLNSELRLDRLLEIILDTLLDLTDAERCFVLLGGGDAPFSVAAARNIDAAQLAHTGSFSRSIAERAAAEALPIVTFDAAGDERFEAALSVSDLKLRSVLAVPLLVKGRAVGCLYADHRLRAGLFGELDVELVVDLAEQAAIALDNARLAGENERNREAVATLNRELAERVAAQAVELDELHKEVRHSRAALDIRYDYKKLVGRTPRMLELFRLLDRVTDTALPIVIYGESGTGKELVARAIHHNGPRRGKPFVSESCGAIPETLLEAALFGHVRGAFTGADADRRGLFEIAHQGTLFLDEVGEMPPSMQVKLLRVLTTGEFRRLGSERAHQVDVRILAASNRDLGKMVEEGRFREDLFYRLNVVRVALPPLRERSDDIPLLIEHFLTKHAAVLDDKPRRIERAALQRLCAYRWPGNVRQLENEILRASALSNGIITVADLSPQLLADAATGTVESPDDLGLKRRVESLEQTLIKEALGRTDGNQSQAARLLGLSRFGLQKKVRRYNL